MGRYYKIETQDQFRDLKRFFNIYRLLCITLPSSLYLIFESIDELRPYLKAHQWIIIFGLAPCLVYWIRGPKKILPQLTTVETPKLKPRLTLRKLIWIPLLIAVVLFANYLKQRTIRNIEDMKQSQILQTPQEFPNTSPSSAH